MEGINYLTDDKNKIIAVQIDLRKYGEQWEDFYDYLIAEYRKGEKETSWEEIKKELKQEGRL